MAQHFMPVTLIWTLGSWDDSNGVKLSNYNIETNKDKFHVHFRNSIITMFGLKWKRKYLGECKAKTAWNENRKKSEFWRLRVFVLLESGKKSSSFSMIVKVTSLSKSLWVHSWNLNLDIVQLFGCFVARK